MEWCGRSGQQSPRGCKVDSNVNTLNNNKKIQGSTFFKILRKIKGNSTNNCESLKFIISNSATTADPVNPYRTNVENRVSS